MNVKFKRVWSLVLVLVMILPVTPLQAFATDQGGQSVILPIGENDADTELLGMQTRSISKTPVYFSVGSISVSLPDIKKPEIITETIDGVRIQAIDDNTIVAQTGSFNIHRYDTSLRGETLFALDLLDIGSYPLQLVYGDVQNPITIPLDYVLTVVDAPVITNGYIGDLTAGTVHFQVDLRVAGYDGKADNFSFSLVDESENEIPCMAIHIETWETSYGVSSLTYRVMPDSEIIEDMRYSLKISVDEGELYSSATSISTRAQPTSTDIAILEVLPDDTAVGGLIIKVGGVIEGGEYTVTVAQDRSTGTNYVFNDKISPIMENGNGIFKISLVKNGISLPLSAYQNTNFYVNVGDNEGNEDSLSYYNKRVYDNQRTSLSLEEVSNNKYKFTLTGQNMLLDLYEVDDLYFVLKERASISEYVQVGSTDGSIEKSIDIRGDSVYFEFSGIFVTEEELASGRSYLIFHKDENLAYASIKSDEIDETLRLSSFYSQQCDRNSGTFYFNFDQFLIDITLGGSSDTAIAQLYDITTSSVVSETGPINGTPDSEGYYSFSFVITKPSSVDVTHDYTIHIVSDNQTLDLSEHGSSYTFTYDDDIIYRNDFRVKGPVFVGDETLTLVFFPSAIKNIPPDYFIENKLDIVNQAIGISLAYSDAAAKFLDHLWYLELALDKPIGFGTYSYCDYSKFEVIAAGSPVLGNCRVDSETKSVYITDCSNLSELAYTAILYDTSEGGHGKLADLTLTRQDANTLLVSDGLPSDLSNGSYTLEIYAEDKYIGAINLYVDWNAKDDSVCTIKGYDDQLGEILYQTDSGEVYLYTYNPGYAYVRYSEDADFGGADYTAIRQYRQQKIMLSEDDGIKIIYVQFKTSLGEESRVYTWTCEKVTEIIEPTIVKAWLAVDGMEVTRIPEETDFTINLISSSRLVDVYSEFFETDGSAYYKSYPLIYKGQTDEGYLFQITLNSGDYLFYYKDFSAVNCCLTDISGNSVISSVTIPVSFKALEHIVFNDWGDYGSDVYTSQNHFEIRGHATPDATVTVICDNKEYSTQANNIGAFSVAVTGLSEGAHRVTASDSRGLSTDNYQSYNLIVDKTAPKIDTLKAAMDAGNVIISWTTTSTDVAYYLIWVDGATVKRAGDKYTATSYISVGSVGSTFKVVAVDHAGNQSEAKTVTVGDNEPPTTPGEPILTAHGTKSISFSWEASTDNVAVYQYKIYRDSELIDTVGYNVTSYTDVGLAEDTTYQYEIYALDRANNESEAAEASLSTAVLAVDRSTIFDSEYIKEENPNGVEVRLYLDDSDGYYAKENVITKLRYKPLIADEWSELVLIGAPTIRSGTWIIEDLTIGEYEVCFYVVDAEGTEKETEIATVKINQDTIPPDVTVTYPSPSDILSGEGLVIRGYSTDNVEVNRIELLYSIDAGKTYEEIATLINEETSRRDNYSWEYAFDASALPSGQITIKAVAFDGRDNNSEDTLAFVLDNTPPEPPNGFNVSNTSEYIGLFWSYPEQGVDSDFHKFKVYRSISTDGPFEHIGGDGGVNFYDTATNGIVSNTLYYYYVTAMDFCGNESEPTAVLSGIMETDSTPPTIASYLPLQNEVLCKEANISVSLYDNSLLKKLDIKYRKSGETDWDDLGTININKGSAVLKYTWDISVLEPGEYQVKFVAEDASGLTSEKVAHYIIKPYTTPVPPTNIMATGKSHREIVLSWNYTGDNSLLSGFRILRKGGQDIEFTPIKYISDPEATSHTDTGLIIDTEYSYKIEAVDRWNETAVSEPIFATAPSNDMENPVAIIAETNLMVAKDKPITLTGSGSSDNDAVSSYYWDFGDGTTDLGEVVTHTYVLAGSYTVMLTVTDLAGNSDTDTTTLNVVDLSVEEGMREISLNVLDASTLDPLQGAEIKILDPSEDAHKADITLVTDSNGQVSAVLKDGNYSVQTVYNGYLLRTNNITVSDNSSTNITIGMSRANMLVGGLTATEMTIDEMIAAGIDIEDPDNQHVYKFAVVLEFIPAPDQKYQIPINFFANYQGEILGWGGTGGVGGGGFHFKVPNWAGTIFPINQNAFLIIYGEAHWLKEMFHVQLLLNNTSATDYIEDVSAKLVIPEGLSLATMSADAGNQNRTVQTIDIIAEQSAAAVDWYVRGDKEGEYNLIADVSGTYMPNPEEFTVAYITKEPIKVLAGSALHLYVEAEKYALKGTDYTVNFRLENVSDKSIYNLVLDILGGRFTEDFSVTDIEYVGDLQGMWNNGKPLGIDELKPGTSIEGRFIIKFDADFIEEAVPYMLTSMFGFTREGSTTEIPMTFVWVNNLIGDIFEETILLDLSDEERKSYTITKFGAVGQEEEHWQTSKEHIVTVNKGVVTAVDVGDAVVSFYNPLTGETHLYSIIVCDSSEVFWKAGTFYYSNDDKKRGNFSSNYLYSDSYFFDSAYQYNHNLAIMSLNLAMSAFAKYDHDVYKDYGVKSENVEDLLTQLEFENFKINQGFRRPPTTDSIGVVAANKKITAEDGSKYTLIAVAIRGGGYEREWASNFTVGNEGHHQGFREARDQVIEFLNSYITNTEGIEGPVKIWITGFSRGAATANLVAAALTDCTKRLPNSVFLAGGRDVYAYCFETPAGLRGNNTLTYNNIFNIVNPNDPVPKVAPAAWGYGRYGKTFYLPSAGTNVNYANLQRNMLMKYGQLPSVSVSEYTVDDFSMISFDTKRWKMHQDIFLNELIDCIAINAFKMPDVYTSKHEATMRNIGEAMGANYLTQADKWRYLVNKTKALWAVSWQAIYHNDLTATLISNLSGLGGAHYPELCLAWMQSLTLSSEYSFSGYNENTGYYKIYLNCPIDIEVFDDNGNLVAAIENDVPADITDSFIASIFCDNGQKTIYLPANGTYSIKLTATDDGTMNYSIGEYNLNCGGFSRMVNYYNVNIKNGDTFNATIEPPTNADDNTLYTLDGGSGTIEPSEDMSGSDVEKGIVTLEHFGCGTVLGAGTRIKGEFAKIIAYPDEGYEFKGWYINNDLQSSEPEYRFCVLSDIVLTAVFERVGGTDNGNNHNGSGDDSGGSVTTGGTTEAKPTVEYNDGGKAVIKDGGNIEIVPDEGYILKKILINGEPATEEALKNLKPTDTVNVVFEKIVEWINPYGDVNKSDWFYEAVKHVSENDLMVGTGGGKFEPNTMLSRAMLVTILWRLEGEPDYVITNSFIDLAQDWYKDAVTWAAEHKIVEGYGNERFGPGDPISREQVAVILYRYSQFKGHDVSMKSDLAEYIDTSEISNWAVEAMKWANAEGLITGRSASILAPRGTTTRAEIATVIQRYLTNYPFTYDILSE